MELKEHVIDTLKEWQLKMGDLGSGIMLYYPKESVCQLTKLNESLELDDLIEPLKGYFFLHAPELGDIGIGVTQGRFCIQIPKEGCDYVTENVEFSDFLKELLDVLKEQKMESIVEIFEKYAKLGQGNVIVGADEHEHGAILSFDNPEIDPYVYCFDQDDFGITYHRFLPFEWDNL